MATQFNIFVLTCKGTENTRQGQKVFTPATRLFNALYNHEPNPSHQRKSQIYQFKQHFVSLQRKDTDKETHK